LIPALAVVNVSNGNLRGSKMSEWSCTHREDDGTMQVTAVHQARRASLARVVTLTFGQPPDRVL
jgi:hypothetical protein